MTLIFIVIGVVACAIGAGALVKYFTDRSHSVADITQREFVLGVFIITVLVAPLTALGSYKLALNSRANFVEFHNGYETAADVTAVPCSRDGPCYWDYKCDPYVVMVTETYSCGTADKPQTCTRLVPETRYHQCPYVRTEYHYRVQTSLDQDYWFARARFPDNPDAHRWRASEAVPAYIAQRAGVGVPQDWAAVKARLLAGLPGPVTRTAQYENFVLASEYSILKQWSGEARRLDSLKLLPPPTQDVYAYYQANKVGAIRWPPGDWPQRLAYLNSVAGPKLHADVRLVVVRLPERIGADDYVFALLAHWQNTEKFGQFALPKNTLIVVLGTDDGRRVSWGRAATGMPMGNEALIIAARTAFTGKPLDPDTIIGTTRWQQVEGRLQPVHGKGVLEGLVFGLTNPATKFARVSMKAEQATDIGTGFLYLKGEIRPSTGGWVFIIVMTFIASMAVWGAMLFIGVRNIGIRYHY